MSLLGEIKRRKLFQVAAVYAVVAWLLVQIVATIEQPLSIPDWADTLVIVLVVIGFPLAMVLAWAQDGSSRVTVRAVPSDSSESTSDAASTDPDQAIERQALPNSIAVLPFENLSAEQRHAFFAAGIHEAILNQLVKLSDLHVMSRTSVLRYADGQTPIAQIAAELNVHTVLEGSVQYADDRVRITAQLIGAETGAHLWSEMYDRESSDVFLVQTDIATQIASALQAELTPRERETLKQRPTSSAEAYALYLQAISLSTLAGGIEAAPAESANFLRCLDEALTLDPQFALAYALKAREYAYSMSRPVRRTDILSISARDELAQENAERALELDPGSGVAYSGLAVAHRFARRDAEAEAALVRALELNPYEPRVLRDVAFFNVYRGKQPRAIEFAQRIVSIDPAVGYVISAAALWHQGNIGAAQNTLNRALALNPRLFAPQIFAAWVALLQGQKDEALESLRVAEKLGVAEAGGATFLPMLAAAYGQLERLQDAKRVADEIDALAETFVVTDSARALASLAIGDRDAALRALQQAAEHRSPGEDINEAVIAFNMLPLPILEEPEFVALRSRLSVATPTND